MDFASLAKKRVSGSDVMQGKTKVDLDTIIARWPQGVTVTDFDFLSGNNGDYVICNYGQDPECFFSGGKILTDIFKSFVEAYDGDVQKTREEYRKEPVTFKLSHGKTKKGNRVTLVEIVG